MKRCSELFYFSPLWITSNIGFVYVHVDIDHCASKPCLNDGTCQNVEDGFKCECQSGWMGDTCEG